MPYCPNCSCPLEPDELACPKCTAIFGPGSSWSPTEYPSGPVPFRPLKPADQPAEDDHPSRAGGFKELPLEFRGSATEYFRIWAVNLCLTLLTLGVFSAWAKVRKKRYFYSHTTLDGTPFQYLGEPLPILKGRLLAVALFLVYYAASRFLTGLLPYVMAAGLLLAPWVISRSAAFNARYSAWRNIRFGFDGNYLGAVQTIYWLGLVPMLAIVIAFDLWMTTPLYGLAFLAFAICFPWWLARLKRYLVRYTEYGSCHGNLEVSGGSFFKVYFVGGLIITVIGALSGFLILEAFSPKKIPVLFYAATVAAYAGYVLGFAYIQANSGNLVWNGSRLGPVRFRSTLSTRPLAKLYLTNAVAILCSLGLATPWAVIRTMKYRAENFFVAIDGDLAEFENQGARGVAAAAAEIGEMFDLDLSL